MKPMFRFTIRDLLWLMVVVAVGCAWWADHRQSRSQIEKLIDLVGPPEPIAGGISVPKDSN